MKRFIKCPVCGTPIIGTFNKPEGLTINGIDASELLHGCSFNHKGCCEGFEPANEIEVIPALSIRQPWAWLIANGHKDIENRNTMKNFRGTFLIHASSQFDKNAFNTFPAHLRAWKYEMDCVISELGENAGTNKGGIIGYAEITDCVQESNNPWFIGKNGFVIEKPQLLNFTPCKGKLGFFIPEID